jgi:hypothetical protein
MWDPSLLQRTPAFDAIGNIRLTIIAIRMLDGPPLACGARDATSDRSGSSIGSESRASWGSTIL